MKLFATTIASLALLTGCAPEDDGPTEADDVGVAAQCSADADCPVVEVDTGGDTDGTLTLQCLNNFKGGYCGLAGCTVDTDCPEASACIAHTDGQNYCFRLCANKPECNYNRSADNEANCSANIEFTDGGGGKACVPPEGG